MPKLDSPLCGRDPHLSWTAIFDGSADRYDRRPVTVTGWIVTAAETPASTYCLLTFEPACCRGCLPRRITPEHARVVAGTGGVIGIWPPASLFPDLDALAEGIARMADVVGPAHVGIGSDMMGLVGPSALPDYSSLPDLAGCLLARFSPDEAAGILGGNYLRVAKACLLA